MTLEQMEKTRLLSPEELGPIIRFHRTMRKWSQETLSAVSRLSVRTIQRVENGKPSDGDTRRALARAFELADIDVFNKPYRIPTVEQLKADQEKFDREHVMLEAHVAASGQELVRFFETTQAYVFSSSVTLSDVASLAFAELTDYLKDHADAADLISEVDKLHVFDVVQEHIDTLRKAGFSLCYARRKGTLGDETWESRLAIAVAYIAIFPGGKEPTKFAVERQWS